MGNGRSGIDLSVQIVHSLLYLETEGSGGTQFKYKIKIKNFVQYYLHIEGGIERKRIQDKYKLL